MQIKKPLHSLHKHFAELDKGECFYSEGEYYMKTYYRDEFMAVNLETGGIHLVSGHIKIIPLPKAFIDPNWR